MRELVNALERAVVLSPGGTIRSTELPDHVVAPGGAPQGASSDPVPGRARHVLAVLADSATLEEAAARLGVNPTTLWRMRKRWGI